MGVGRERRRNLRSQWRDRRTSHPGAFLANPESPTSPPQGRLSEGPRPGGRQCWRPRDVRHPPAHRQGPSGAARRVVRRSGPGRTPRPGVACPPSSARAHLAGKGPREQQLERLPLQLHQAGVAVLAPDAAVRAGGGAAAAARARGARAEARRAAQGARRAGADARGRGPGGAGEGARGRGARAGGRGPRRAERRARALRGGPAPGARLLVRFPIPAFGGEGRRGLGGRAAFVHLRGRHAVAARRGGRTPRPGAAPGGGRRSPTAPSPAPTFPASISLVVPKAPADSSSGPQTGLLGTGLERGVNNPSERTHRSSAPRLRTWHPPQRQSKSQTLEHLPPAPGGALWLLGFYSFGVQPSGSCE